jgi:hypothetical protein
MKTCTHCGHVNEDNANACAGCGKNFPAASRKKVDPRLQDPTLAPKIVATFSNLEQASVLKARLEAAGIEAWIPEEFEPQVFSAVIPLERITVRVAAKDFEAAQAVLAQPAASEEGSASESETTSGQS